MVLMTTVSISEPKANLSCFVRDVRRGGEVQILDRETPVARLVPAVAGDHLEVRERLIRQGLLRPGKAKADAILGEPPLVLSVSAPRVLAGDRDDRL